MEQKQRQTEATAKIRGKLWKNPRILDTKKGSQMGAFSLAINKKDQKTGTWSNTYFDIIEFMGPTGLKSQSLIAGDIVEVTGDLAVDTFVTTQGEKRTRVQVKANLVEVVGKFTIKKENGDFENFKQTTAQAPQNTFVYEEDLPF